MVTFVWLLRLPNLTCRPYHHTSAIILSTSKAACFAMTDEVTSGVKRKAEDPSYDIDVKKIKQGRKELRPGFGEDKFNETEYYFENGLRKVYPYNFTYTTFCKGRWVGHLLLDVFSREFRALSKDAYKNALESGRVTVNSAIVGPDYRLKDNDLLANSLHRHEVPVIGAPIKVIHKCDDMLVIDKPPSIPVHPCGRYRHNSVLFILAKEHNLKGLHTIHRLDRLTSGLLLFGCSLEKARAMESQIKSRQVQKEYLCRVEGRFPDEPITCSEPIEVISHKIGVCGVGKYGKDCCTEFKKLSYNGKSSVVHCKPHTGRMHQIRVHLQYLGFPIVNDPLYNDTVFGIGKAKGGLQEKTKEQLIEDMLKAHSIEKWLGPECEIPSDESLCEPTDSCSDSSNALPADAREDAKPDADGSSTETSHFPASLRHYIETDEQFKAAVENQRFNKQKYVHHEDCLECRRPYKDPRPEDLLLYLHCLRYKGKDWEYETTWPAWAREDWTLD
ncbi:pseudouridylate synthase RPUSD2-like [Ornithodoros turicata]